MTLASSLNVRKPRWNTTVSARYLGSAATDVPRNEGSILAVGYRWIACHIYQLRLYNTVLQLIRYFTKTWFKFPAIVPFSRFSTRHFKFPGLSAGTEKLCIFGHLRLVFIWSCFVSWLLFLLFYVICAPIPTDMNTSDFGFFCFKVIIIIRLNWTRLALSA